MTPASERSAAFFDLDKTVIARSSTLAFSRPFYAGGLISRSSMLRSAYAHFFYQASGADHDQIERMRQYLSRMVAGWDVQQVRDIVATTLSELIAPLVYEEATALIAEHHAAGRDVVIVSASGAEVVEPIGAMLGVEHVVATRMVIANGRSGTSTRRAPLAVWLATGPTPRKRCTMPTHLPPISGETAMRGATLEANAVRKVFTASIGSIDNSGLLGAMTMRSACTIACKASRSRVAASAPSY